MTIPIENKGDSPLHLAGFVILPGETRFLPKHLVPMHVHAVVEAAPAVTDALAEFAAKKVSEIRDELTALPDDFIERLAALESAREKPRAGVVEAITKEKLRRADQREKLQEFKRAAGKMDAAALRAYRDNVAQHPELVAAIDTELQARAGG